MLANSHRVLRKSLEKFQVEKNWFCFNMKSIRVFPITPFRLSLKKCQLFKIYKSEVICKVSLKTKALQHFKDQILKIDK